MALASSIISRADYKRPWLRGEQALSMTTRLHNFIVTEMGGFFCVLPWEDASSAGLGRFHSTLMFGQFLFFVRV